MMHISDVSSLVQITWLLSNLMQFLQKAWKNKGLGL